MPNFTLENHLVQHDMIGINGQFTALQQSIAASIGGILGGFDTYAQMTSVPPAGRTKGGWIVRNDETRGYHGELYVNTGTAYNWIITWPYEADDIIVLTAAFSRIMSAADTDVQKALNTIDANVATRLHGSQHYYGGTDPVNDLPFHGVVSRPVGANNPLPVTISTTTFTLGATANPISYYYQGIPVTVSADKTTTLSGAAGIYWIYFDAATGNLLNSTNFPGFSLTSNVLIALVSWNGSNLGLVNDERHDSVRNLDWHFWAHMTVGCRYVSGITLTHNGGTGNGATFATTSGSIADEDIAFVVNASSAFPTPNTARHWYQTGASTYTFKAAVSTIPYVNSGAASYLPQYVASNNSYTLTTASSVNNRYFNYFVYATTDLHTPIYIFAETFDASVVGNGYASTANARAIPFPNLSGLVSPELKPLYRIVVRADGVVQALVAADDYRTILSLPQSAGNVSTNAAAVIFNPYNSITATNVQSAIEQITDDARLNSYGIPTIIDGGGFAIKTGSGSSIAISGNGTIVTFTSTAHGLQTGDQIIVSVVANAAVLPLGIYSVTYIDANNFSVINAGVATTSTCTYTYCLTGQLGVRSKFLVSGWELIGDITGNATVQIFYASAYNGTFSEITGGGISISASKVATGTNSGWTTTTFVQYGYLKFAVTANAGAMTNISVNIKGAKIV